MGKYKLKGESKTDTFGFQNNFRIVTQEMRVQVDINLNGNIVVPNVKQYISLVNSFKNVFIITRQNVKFDVMPRH